jgi:hypothetical protein
MHHHAKPFFLSLISSISTNMKRIPTFKDIRVHGQRGLNVGENQLLLSDACETGTARSLIVLVLK